ncbi:MAG: phosphatidylglycerophosphatase A [Desulfobulbus sp.]|jgi:phosphatidylglycerophosphatase A|uniref:phosphatidylglycerophosphatase A family protein n=1 Tax=Desulfobulbus sp. TaxID=895 RepID=UPI00283CCA35|nr:phosphatidylglycerophosphatase A [Desulfobulbus sp.]MDR2549579.1 phosphatidylglycerophosphatase A [Desulfobulbus sp.]
MDRVLMFIATGAGSGYLPVAPGTWGSAVGVLLWLALSRLEAIPYLAVVAVLFVLGVFGAGAAEKIVDRPDPSIVVIDEIVGQLITLCFAPPHPAAPVAGFFLFRFFDILKPFPAGWIDRHLHGGLGIMLDDVVAGLYALLTLHLGYWLLKML